MWVRDFVHMRAFVEFEFLFGRGGSSVFGRKEGVVWKALKFGQEREAENGGGNPDPPHGCPSIRQARLSDRPFLFIEARSCH